MKISRTELPVDVLAIWMTQFWCHILSEGTILHCQAARTPHVFSFLSDPTTVTTAADQKEYICTDDMLFKQVSDSGIFRLREYQKFRSL
ncbi:hypothetical protein SNE40_010403 [Patella caerulea]|uniref:Uncharacterized protein n=1 Tax=Patella caerulea TaxID=87958 RepID=A0AAN8JQE5_PATCE